MPYVVCEQNHVSVEEHLWQGSVGKWRKILVLRDT